MTTRFSHEVDLEIAKTSDYKKLEARVKELEAFMEKAMANPMIAGMINPCC